MIELLISDIRTTKIKLAFIIYIVFITAILISILPIDESKANIYFNVSLIILNFNDIYAQVTKMVISIFTLIISINHDKNHHINIAVTKSRTYVVLYKTLVYLSLTIGIVTLTFTLNVLLISILGFNFLITRYLILLFVDIIIDNSIICLLFLCFYRIKGKIISFCMYFLYLLGSFINFQENNMVLFYLMPTSNLFMSRFNFYYIYKIIYILCLLLLNFTIYLKEKFE